MIPRLRRLLPALLLFPLAAHGTLVTTTTDEDDATLGGGTGISLREAVKYSPAGDTITFAPALSGQTIRLTLGEITIAQSLTIDASALPVKITLSGDKTGDGKTPDDTRILNITTGTVLLDSLILSGGSCPAGTTSSAWGAGIYINSITAKLTVRKSTFSGNSATAGGAINFFGQLNNPNSFVRIENSTFIGNTATGEAGAIRTFGNLLIYDTTFTANTAQLGGVIYSRDGTLQIANSHFAGNSATSEGGAIWTYRALSLTASTFTGNSAPYGGGIYSSFNAVITIENSTLTANTARDFGGGILISGPTTTLLHTTLTGNTAQTGGGGGIWRKTSGTTPAGTLSLDRSIVTGNTAPTTPNINTSGTFTGTHNLTTGDPRLAPLGNYGGPTQTMPPLTTSPAIDAGGTTTLTTDQRGLPRDALPDIGAVEYTGTRTIAAPILDPAGDATLSFGTPRNTPGFAWVLSRSPDLRPGSYTEIYRYQSGADIATPGTTFVRTAAFITVTDANAPPGSGYYRIGLLPVR